MAKIAIMVAPTDESLRHDYLAAGFWGTDTIRQVVSRLAATNPEGLAFASEGAALTWRGYDTASSELAHVFTALSPQPGDRIAVLLADGPGVHTGYLAAEKAGLVVVGIGPRAGEHEIAYLVDKTEAKLLLTSSTHGGRNASELLRALDARGVSFEHVVTVDGPAVGVDGVPVSSPSRGDVGEARPIDADELFLLNSTSGTTGLPKCVTQFQNRWMYFHQLAVDAADLCDSDVFMSVVPAPFGFGLWTAHFTPTLLGAPVILTNRFAPDAALELIERHKVTVLSCVSTQFIMLLNSPSFATRDLTSLRVMFTGGEAVPYARAAEFERCTGAAVLQFYGSNETGAVSVTTLRDPQRMRLTTAGRVIPNMHVRLLDPDTGFDALPGAAGQPACRGPATCAGYYEDEAADRALYTSDGWMLMGDLCTIDAQGYLQVVGRLSDIIIRGGKNISAVSVEQEVASHPKVQLAAAVAMPDDVFGEKVCVFVEVQEGESINLFDLTAHLRERGVTPEWWPERLEVRSMLPRSAGEKIAKGALRTEIARLIAKENHEVASSEHGSHGSA